MKSKQFLLFIAAGLFAASCSSVEATEEGTEEEVVEAVTYTLDTKNSIINWKGSAGPDYGHTGTVAFSKGSIEMEGDALTSGSFVVDMSTIKNTDIPEAEKAEGLVRHLKGLDDNEEHKPEDYFNINKFPNITVTTGDYKDGKLEITLNIVGKELKQKVDVKLSAKDDAATMTGKFTLDLSSLGIPGFSKEAGVSPKIDFELDAKLKK